MMNLSIKDLNSLIELEQFLYSKGIKTKSKQKECEFGEQFHKLYNIIEKLLVMREKSNKKTYERIFIKRQTDKTYGRSKKEIENMQRVALKNKNSK